MEQKALRKTMWEEAGKAGLVLGIVSTAYLFITQLLTKVELSALVSMAVNVLLWTGKFAGCIWLMMFFMKKLVKDFPQAQNSSTFRFGCLTAVLSSLIYAAVSFANYEFLFPDYMSGQMDAMMQQMAPMMDSNTLAQTEKMLDNMSSITFFSNLIYCSIYGILLSGILSRMIPSKDPFAGYKSDEQ